MKKIRAFAVCYFVLLSVAAAQQTAPAQNPEDTDTGGKRIFWIIPNFRTSPTLNPYVPISTSEKFKIAAKDAFDPGTFALAAAFAGVGQLNNSDRTFGQGVKGYAHYWATSYADYAVGDFMTEAIYPALLHQDPRYFRKGKGSGMSRLGYAASQIFVTHNDSGKLAPNYSELLGNSTAVAISMSYYPDSRNAGDAATKLGTQLGVDMASNILKEFWPDLSRKLKKHK
jgi:hypothetical protein